MSTMFGRAFVCAEACAVSVSKDKHNQKSIRGFIIDRSLFIRSRARVQRRTRLFIARGREYLESLISRVKLHLDPSGAVQHYKTHKTDEKADTHHRPVS
jgi:hypothetical protein